MSTLSFQAYLWAICFAFGAFCVWQACRIILKLGTTASANPAGSGSTALQLQLGQWIKIAATSPAVAFFMLGIAAGIALPAYYSYLYRPGGPSANQTVTIYGTFASAQPNVCFQADAVTHSNTGYVIKLPRQTHSIDFAIEPPNMSTATNLLLELDGDLARYAIDNAPSREIAIDVNGIVHIPDPIAIGVVQPGGSLTTQPLKGAQVMRLDKALQGLQP